MAERTEYAIAGEERDGELWIGSAWKFLTLEDAREWLAGPTAGWARRAGAYIMTRTVTDWERVPERGESA